MTQPDDTATVAAIVRKSMSAVESAYWERHNDAQLLCDLTLTAAAVRLALRQGAKGVDPEFKAQYEIVKAERDAMEAAMPKALREAADAGARSALTKLADGMPYPAPKHYYSVARPYIEDFRDREYPEKPTTPAPSRTLAHVVADLAGIVNHTFPWRNAQECAEHKRVESLAAEAQRIAEGTT